MEQAKKLIARPILICYQSCEVTMRKAFIIFITGIALIAIHCSLFINHCYAQDDTEQVAPAQSDTSVDDDESSDNDDTELDNAELDQIDPWLLEPSDTKK
jgi:hypothetical protein